MALNRRVAFSADASRAFTTTSDKEDAFLYRGRCFPPVASVYVQDVWLWFDVRHRSRSCRRGRLDYGEVARRHFRGEWEPKAWALGRRRQAWCRKLCPIPRP